MFQRLLRIGVNGGIHVHSGYQRDIVILSGLMVTVTVKYVHLLHVAVLSSSIFEPV
jgi:hypothetical protein